MSAAVKKVLPKVKPLLSREAASFVKKRRLGSQRTIDTNYTNQQQQQQNQNKLNQEQLLRQITLTLQTISNYKPNLRKNKAQKSEYALLREKETDIQRIDRQIHEIEDEIIRLKEIYNHPKGFTLANQYTQLHLKHFTLADQITKQRKHLELHITQHSKIKGKAQELQKDIKALLPRYGETALKKGFKAISYGQFRQKVLLQRRQKEIKSRMRSITSRLSNRSRSTSIRSIISGKSQDSQLSAEKKNMYHLQRRKSIATRARVSTRNKYDREANELRDKILFLKEEDGNLNIKIDELTKQIASLEASILSSNSFAPSRRISIQNL